MTPAVNGSEDFLYQSDVFTDSDISVTVSFPSSDPNAAAGINFWGTDTNNFFQVAVFGDGTFQILRCVAGRFIYPVPGNNPAASFNKAPGAKNVIRVVTQGTKITFYLNGTQLVTTTGQVPAGGGSAGIYAQSGTKSTMTTTFTDFKVLSVQ